MTHSLKPFEHKVIVVESGIFMHLIAEKDDLVLKLSERMCLLWKEVFYLTE